MKNIIITGTSSGIGLELVKIYSKNGYNVIKEIIKNTKKILSKSIKLGGASIKDFSSSNGKKGSFQQHFRAYAREGEKCSNIDCKEKIKRIIISNRSSFYCLSCQK